MSINTPLSKNSLNFSEISSRGFEYGVKHILSPHQGPLIEILRRLLPEDLALTAEFLIEMGAVYHLGQRVRNPQTYIQTGDYLRIHSKPRRFAANHFDWKKKVLFQNEEFVVVDKPGGLPCHPSVDNCLENLCLYLESFLKCPLYITHRLDVPTRGLMVLAKKPDFQKDFNRALSMGVINKYYVTIIERPLEPGVYTHYMEPGFRAPKKVATEGLSDWKVCQLEVLSCRPLENFYELEIKLLTGRTHQIRAQLAALGCPVHGDILYGSPWKLGKDQISLTAWKLEFPRILTQKINSAELMEDSGKKSESLEKDSLFFQFTLDLNEEPQGAPANS